MSGLELAGLVLNAIEQIDATLPEGGTIRAGYQGRTLSALLRYQLSSFQTNIEYMLRPIQSIHVFAGDVFVDRRRADWTSSDLEVKLRDFYGRSYKHLLSFITQTGSLVDQISGLKTHHSYKTTNNPRGRLKSLVNPVESSATSPKIYVDLIGELSDTNMRFRMFLRGWDNSPQSSSIQLSQQNVEDTFSHFELLKSYPSPSSSSSSHISSSILDENFRTLSLQYIFATKLSLPRYSSAFLALVLASSFLKPDQTPWIHNRRWTSDSIVFKAASARRLFLGALYISKDLSLQPEGEIKSCLVDLGITLLELYAQRSLNHVKSQNGSRPYIAEDPKVPRELIAQRWLKSSQPDMIPSYFQVVEWCLNGNVSNIANGADENYRENIRKHVILPLEEHYLVSFAHCVISDYNFNLELDPFDGPQWRIGSNKAVGLSGTSSFKTGPEKATSPSIPSHSTPKRTRPLQHVLQAKLQSSATKETNISGQQSKEFDSPAATYKSARYDEFAISFAESLIDRPETEDPISGLVSPRESVDFMHDIETALMQYTSKLSSMSHSKTESEVLQMIQAKRRFITLHINAFLHLTPIPPAKEEDVLALLHKHAERFALFPAPLSTETTIHFDDVRAFLTDNEHFLKLRFAIMKEMYYPKKASLKSIEKGIKKSLLATEVNAGEENRSPNYRRTFRIYWELRDFMLYQFDRDDQDILPVLTLSGSAVNAQAAPCIEYVEQNWGDKGVMLLLVIQQALKNGESVSEEDQRPFVKVSCPRTAQPAPTYGVINTFTAVTAMGSEKDLIRIAQQLAWMSATFRRPYHSSIMLSEVNFAPAQLGTGSDFDITVLKLQHLPRDSFCCWHILFAKVSIAAGFPIPHRVGFTGLEIDIALMTSLAGAFYPIQFSGGLLLKGFSTLFVPVKLDEEQQSIQWHLLAADPGKFITVEAISTECPQWEKIADLNTIWESKAFLAYSPEVEIHLGTADTDWEKLGYTKLNLKTAKFQIDGFGFGAMLGPMNFGGLSANLNCKIGKYQANQHFSVHKTFEAMCNETRELPVLLYDLAEDEKRAWLVPALAVILHITLKRMKRFRIAAERRDGENVNPAGYPYASASWNAGDAAFEAIEKTRLEPKLKVREKMAGSKQLDFESLVLLTWGLIDGAIQRKIEIIKEARPEVFRVRKKSIHGWELMDFVTQTLPFTFNEVVVDKSSAGWEHLSSHLLTIFSDGLGEVIRPIPGTSICRKLSPPHSNSFLIASIRTLKDLAEKCGYRSSCAALTRTGLKWDQGDTCPFDPCDKPGRLDCKCQRLQRLVRQKDFKGIRSPEYLPDKGAVIFGKLQTVFKVAIRNNEN